MNTNDYQELRKRVRAALVGVAAGATASIRHLRSSTLERERHQERARTVKARLTP